MGYYLKGSLLEVCDCHILCPCWVGEDPDGGTCNTALAWHFEKGTIEGVDVSGLTLGLVGHVPGNILEGNIRAVFFIDDRATDAQGDAIMNVFSGQLGGPVLDFSKLVGEVVAVEQAPIDFQVEKGKGSLRIGATAQATLEPFRSATGEPTSLHNTAFSTIPGAPAYVGKAEHFRLTSPPLGIDLELQGHNAIQGQFLFEHS